MHDQKCSDSISVQMLQLLQIYDKQQREVFFAAVVTGKNYKDLAATVKTNVLHGDKKQMTKLIVEQNWKIKNQLTFAKNLRARKFKFMLYDCKKIHNKKN